jgi:hypothetical protein
MLWPGVVALQSVQEKDELLFVPKSLIMYGARIERGFLP